MVAKQRPILFNTTMVQAILSGHKTMTRRVIRNSSDIIHDWDKNDPSYGPFFEDKYGDSHRTVDVCPYGQAGDILWVRETTCITPKFWAAPVSTCVPDPDGNMRHVTYKADGHSEDAIRDYKLKWTPSIHVPQWASRLWLKVTDIRVEPLQKISEEDALAEGVNPSPIGITNKTCFKILWDSINGKPRKNGNDISWNANPWVWVVEFERTEKPNENL